MTQVQLSVQPIINNKNPGVYVCTKTKNIQRTCIILEGTFDR